MFSTDPRRRRATHKVCSASRVSSLCAVGTPGITCTVSAVPAPHLLYCVCNLWSSGQSLVSPVLCPQSLVIPVLCPLSLVISCTAHCTMSAVSGPHYVPCTTSAVSGHLLYCVRMCLLSGHLLYSVRSLWSSPVLCPQSLVISCTASAIAVSGHLLYCVCSLWSSPVLCPQSLVISCTVSAVYWSVSGPLYCVRSLWSSSCTVSAVP
ncbi:unnamed protein product, partial [Staurois parvus]